MCLPIIISVSLFFVAMVIISMDVLFSLLGFIIVILTGCFVLFSVGVEFLTFILMFLYLGAIVVLFLFVIMLVRLKTPATRFDDSLSFTGCLVFLVLGFKVLYFSLWFSTGLVDHVQLFNLEFSNFNGRPTDQLFSRSPLDMGGDSVLFLNIFTEKYFFFFYNINCLIVFYGRCYYFMFAI
jgi:NADH:ubiquinone oxidoreductase subunit 6 (subunit J)